MSKPTRWANPTPAQLTAIRFRISDESLSDPRVAKLINFKTRLDAEACALRKEIMPANPKALAPSPEIAGRMAAKIRAAYDFDGEQPEPVADLISAIAQTLFFKARLRKQKPAADLTTPNQKEETHHANVSC